MLLYRKLKDLLIPATLVPTPRQLSKCCGVALMIDPEQVEIVKTHIAAEHINIISVEALAPANDIHRDRFC